MLYIEMYYPELIHTRYLYKRLAIYDLIYYMGHYMESPHIEELKNDVLTAARNIIS